MRKEGERRSIKEEGGQKEKGRGEEGEGRD